MAKKKQLPTPMLVDKGNGRYLLKGVRLSYAFLFNPDEQEGDDGKKKKAYRVTGLIPKDTGSKVKRKLDAIIAEMCEEEYGNPKIAADRKFLRDGDEGDVDDHQGYWTVTVRETRRPTLVNSDRTPLVEEDELLLSGHWANIVIRPWAQNGKSMKKKNKFGKRVNCGFDVVQFVMEDELLGGGGRPDLDDVLDETDEDFEDMEDDGEEDEEEDERPRRRASKPSRNKPSRRRDEEDEDDDDLGF